MKIDTTILHNFSKEKYLEYIHSLTSAHQEKIQTYGTLILTMVAILFFGIFAITPTLSTIFQLRKSLDDNKYVDSQLQIKIAHLTKLQESYVAISQEFPIIYAAVPQTPSTTKLTGQIRTLASNNGVTLRDLSIESVYVAKSEVTKSVLQPFVVNLIARGSDEDLQKFSAALVNFDRIMTIDFVTITVPQEKNATYHQMTIQLTSYYRP